MNLKEAWPVDPVAGRQSAKVFLRNSRFRPQFMFLLSYIVKLGVLDGKSGYEFAASRSLYCKMIAAQEKKLRRPVSNASPTGANASRMDSTTG